jgi:hypothetical protein
MDNKNILQKLIRNVFIIGILIIALILIQQKAYNDYIRANISKASLAEFTSQAEKQFTNFYLPVNQSLTLSKKWGQSGLLELHEMSNINARYIPVLEQIPQVHSVKIVNEKQEVFALTRLEDQWQSDMIKIHNDPNKVLTQYLSSDGGFIREEWTSTKYDVFQRPWYLKVKDSLDTNKASWTKLRYIESAMNFGVTASIKWWVDKQKNQFSVLAYDVLLRDAYESLLGLTVSENSQVFLFLSADSVLNITDEDSLSGNDRDPGKLFKRSDQLENPEISLALQSWEEGGMLSDDPIDISYNNITYWFGVKSIDGEHSRIWIGILIPEIDMLQQLQNRQVANLSFSAAILLIGIIISLIMVRKYRNQITYATSSILRNNNPESGLRELIGKGESSTLEFKSTMRMNLKTNQAGKEIELAWLKAATAFMNSEGGTLLLGVDDGGEYVGIEADNFENEDKYMLHFKNLINQHIGAEFTSYFEFGLIKINEKTIGILECKPSQKPVFLKNKNDEHFYIRSGPSSIKLQTSKILEYIEDRKS